MEIMELTSSEGMGFNYLSAGGAQDPDYTGWIYGGYTVHLCLHSLRDFLTDTYHHCRRVAFNPCYQTTRPLVHMELSSF